MPTSIATHQVMTKSSAAQAIDPPPMSQERAPPHATQQQRIEEDRPICNENADESIRRAGEHLHIEERPNGGKTLGLKFIHMVLNLH